jgi:UDP-N-acetylglucosamine 3-dehydrogenase|tara:strand:- start:1334 stop:1807 length:474 start_codon:yes stop_codon:yes gene_type:complete
MDSNITLAQTKEFLDSEKNGKLIRIEFSNEGSVDSTSVDSNIFLESSINDIETAIWLLDETPQLVFAISGKINNEFDDFATILLGFKDNKTVIISSNWATLNHKRSCNVVSTNGKISLDLTKDNTVVKNGSGDNARKIAEASFLSSQKGIPIYLELK